jgi:hypothetical protein
MVLKGGYHDFLSRFQMGGWLAYPGPGDRCVSL